MKKNILNISIAILIIILVITTVVVIIKRRDDKNTIIVNKEQFVYQGLYDYDINYNNQIITNYDDYLKLFNDNKVNQEDFNTYNYALLGFIYDECSESDIEPADLEIKNNTILAKFTYKASCGVCAPQRMYYLVKVDKEITNYELKADFKARNNPYCDPNIEYKPMIYLYPEKEMNIKVTLGYPELLTTTYPKYNNGWEVNAKPNGDLKANNKYYYGLYWEGYTNIKTDFPDGFLVTKDQLIDFFEEKLSILGLNDKERNEFIIYWLPILEKNEYNLIRFADIKEINGSMPLIIDPKPDTLIRVLMEYKPVTNKINIPEQQLSKANRNGYSVIEWGGTLIK